MKGSAFTLKLSGVLAVAALVSALYFGSLVRLLDCHHADIGTASRDLRQRREGCETALADMSRFENHINTFIEEKEKDIAHLKEKVAKTRKRIGDVAQIKEECAKLEKELAEVKKIVSEIMSLEEER